MMPGILVQSPVDNRGFHVKIETAASIILQVAPTMTAGTWPHSFAVPLQLFADDNLLQPRENWLCVRELQTSVPCVVAMLPSSRRQLTVMVNSNFASSSIGQPNIAWPRTSTGPQVFTGDKRKI
jgi:hypothetical protein